MTASRAPSRIDELLERSASHAADSALLGGDGFALAVATVDGEIHGVGDWERPFPIESISKVFALALAVGRDGPADWRRIGREASGDPFNSLMQLEHDRGVPRNPFINAGAIVVTDILLGMTGDACGATRGPTASATRRSRTSSPATATSMRPSTSCSTTTTARARCG